MTHTYVNVKISTFSRDLHISLVRSKKLMTLIFEMCTGIESQRGKLNLCTRTQTTTRSFVHFIIMMHIYMRKSVHPPPAWNNNVDYDKRSNCFLTRYQWNIFSAVAFLSYLDRSGSKNARNGKKIFFLCLSAL